MSKLIKTSVQLKKESWDTIARLYPDVSRSEFIRLAIDYTLDREPEFVSAKPSQLKDR